MKFSKNKTLVLSSTDIHQIVQSYGLDVLMDKLISRINTAIKQYSPTETIIPARSGFNYEEPQTGLVEWMPLFQYGKQVTIKVVSYHPSNPILHQLPTILSTISAYDTTSGHLLGIVDGVLLTAIRTGAASAVASQYLANPNSKVLGLIGCGAQAVTQLHSLSRLYDFQKVLIYDIDDDTILSFKNRCKALNLHVEIVPSSIKDIVQSSDIICTATSIEVGEGPLFEDLKPQAHVHINAVGSDFPGKTELPLSLLKNSFICPDFLDQALVEGECQQLSKEDIGAELKEVVKHPHNYVHIQTQKSVFDSTGWALEDHIVMELFMECAHELGLGQEIKIETIPNDAKNPYDFLTSTTMNPKVMVK